QSQDGQPLAEEPVDAVDPAGSRPDDHHVVPPGVPGRCSAVAPVPVALITWPLPWHGPRIPAPPDIANQTFGVTMSPGEALLLGGEVADAAAELADDPDEVGQVGTAEAAEPEQHPVDGLGGPERQRPAVIGELGQGSPSVGGVRDPTDQALLLQAVDDVGDAGRVDHEAG